jgi:biotin carboxyl carrier protein
VKYRISVEGKMFEIEVNGDGQVWVDHQLIDVDLRDIDGLHLYSLLVNHRSFEASVEPTREEGQAVIIAGRPYKAFLHGSRQPGAKNIARVLSELSSKITAPLPGWLSEIKVSEGQRIEKGDVVAVLESMKMFMKLRTPQAGVVRMVTPNVSREVAQGEILAKIDVAFPGRDVNQ